MSTRLRVKIVGTTAERTIGQDQYDAQPDAFQILDKPAVDGGGVDIPPKYKTTASAEAAKKKKVASPTSATTTSTEAAEKAESPAVTKEN